MERIKKLKQGARIAVMFLFTVTVSEAAMFLLAGVSFLVGAAYECVYRGFIKGREMTWKKISSAR